MGRILKNLLEFVHFWQYRCSNTMALNTFIDGKSYESALNALNDLQSNAVTIERAKHAKKEDKLPEMLLCLQRVGLKLDEIDKLNIIHVSGTKGKGSTCAFTESILRAHGFKTGFFSSPHIVEVRERIRINGKPISRELFTEYFWDCYRPLNNSKDSHNGLMPAYFRFLTIMAFHAFLQEKVDVVILEVGIGGQYDCTNIIRNPVVCGVSSLGMDHMNVLGSTIEEIAWNKAGIFKKGIPAITVPQKEEAMIELSKRAVEIGAPLYLVPTTGILMCKLGIPGAMQQHNAALAIQLSLFWLENHSKSLKYRLKKYEDVLLATKELPIKCEENRFSSKVLEGLSSCWWPGRCHKLNQGGITFYLDGAHTEESIDVCVGWFQTECQKMKENSQKILWFNSTGDRQPETLLRGLLKCNFNLAIFTPNIQNCGVSNNSDLLMKKLSTDLQIKRCTINRMAWMKLNECQNASSYCNGLEVSLDASPIKTGNHDTLQFPSINDALQWLKNQDQETHVLCTGSLHLIGGILSYLDPDVCNR